MTRSKTNREDEQTGKQINKHPNQNTCAHVRARAHGQPNTPTQQTNEGADVQTNEGTRDPTITLTNTQQPTNTQSITPANTQTHTHTHTHTHQHINIHKN